MAAAQVNIVHVAPGAAFMGNVGGSDNQLSFNIATANESGALLAAGSRESAVTLPKEVNGKPVVISLHGIRTRGDWQKQLEPALGEANFIGESLDYGFFRAIQLVLLFMRERKMKWFLREYERIALRRPGNPSVIAHSLGTYLVARTLLKHAEVKFDRIIFCGSIVNRSYQWSAIFRRQEATRVLNDYGEKDFGPRLRNG